MKIRPILYSLTLNLVVFISMEAQLSVQVGIFNPSGSTLSVRARPSQNIPNQVFGATNVTIRWLTSYGISFGTVTSLYGITPQGDPIINGLHTYQDFGGAPGINIAWAANTENELFSVPVQGGTGIGTFDLDNSGGGGGWYFELGVNGDVTNYADPYYQQSTTGVPLPIQLSSFTALYLGENRARLDWTTLTELNNFGFNVQKSIAQPNNYQTIPNSFVPGHGNTTDPQHYTFTDENVTSGVWYYRLEQIDYDGTRHYTDGVRLDIVLGAKEVAPIEFALLQNYPNPFNPSTEIKFSVEATGRASVKVFNLIGQEVATPFNGMAEAGQYYKVRLDAANLPSGVYFYRLQNENKSELRKMILLK